MRIAVDINGVLRDTLTKIQQVYERWYIDNQIKQEDESFEYEIISPLTSLEIREHLKFKDDDELYDFLYVDHTMEIFAHSPSAEMNTFVDFNEFYLENRDNHDILLVSDEIGKSKPATLFFLSKNGFLGNNIKFIKTKNIEDNWKQCDVWITDNKKIIDLIPENKTGIKFNTTYNQFFTYGKEISKLIEINEPWLKSLEKTTTLTLTESQRSVEQEEPSQTKTELK